MKGQPVFTDEEINAAFPVIPNFFDDGVSREIVVLSKESIPYISKAGNDMVRIEWNLADAHSGEMKTVKFDWKFTDAMRPFVMDKTLKHETSVFRITPTKVGDNLYNGNSYPIYEYHVEYLGEGGNAPVKEPAAVEEIKVSEIPF